LCAGYFIVQSIIIYTLGIKLYQTLHIVNEIASVAVCFFVTLAVSAGGAELFYRAVEVPSHVLSHIAFDWIRE
jgi:peptidoglycan/LPS O-acetylase OafA/YrhL